MRVQLVVAAAQPLVRAVQVEGAGVEETVAQLGAWDAEGLRVPAAILRVSPGDLAGLAPRFASGARAVAAGRLVLAVSESELAGAAPALASIREAARVHVAVTDVGADPHPGADLDYLVDCPGDLIVLAARLSDSALRNDAARAVLADVCEVAHELGWTTVADGIGDGDQRSALAAIGVDQVCGPVAGGPVPAAELGALIDAQGVSLDPRPLPFRDAEPSSRRPAAAAAAPSLPAAAAATAATAATATAATAAAAATSAAIKSVPATAATADAPTADAATADSATTDAAAPPPEQTVPGGWVSDQGHRRRRRAPRRSTGGTVAGSVGVGSPTRRAAASGRDSARPPGTGRRSLDTPSPKPYSGPASSALLLVLIGLLLVAAVVWLLFGDSLF